jgi:hypothetical protein
MKKMIVYIRVKKLRLPDLKFNQFSQFKRYASWDLGLQKKPKSASDSTEITQKYPA